jgi:hypothetical protein
MFEHAKAVMSEIVKGLVRFGKDALGGLAGSDTEPGGSLPLDACHPYGMRSQPRDPDKDAQGNPTDGCGLLIIERGGGDDGAIPTQDPRLTSLPDEGKGGVQLYGWTGSAVSYVLISGADGSITAKVGGGSILLDGTTAVGAAGGAAIARAPELQSRAAAQDAFNAAVSAALVALGKPAPPVVPPLASSVAATKATVV